MVGTIEKAITGGGYYELVFADFNQRNPKDIVSVWL
jgi:hypothetical protein